jgi:hypothetical protein
VIEMMLGLVEDMVMQCEQKNDTKSLMHELKIEK